MGDTRGPRQLAPAGPPADVSRLEDEVRAWFYVQVPALFGPVPAALFGLAEDPRTAGSSASASAVAYPATRAAIAGLVGEFSRHSRERIEIDQTRLFVNAPGGVAAPPYASWYLDGRLSGRSRDWVGEEYRRQGLEIAGDAGEPADFIGAEMEYMHFLGRHATAARLTGDRAALEQALGASARFFEQHLGRWLPRFAERIRAAAAGGVYARLAELLAAFCPEEGEHLRRSTARTAG